VNKREHSSIRAAIIDRARGTLDVRRSS